MNQISLTFLTIGCAPRHDLSAPMERALPENVSVRHVGVLDGLSADQVQQRFAPRPGGAQLITRQSDGADVALDADLVEVALRERMAEIEREGADVVILLCTGEFPSLPSSGWLVLPDAVVVASVPALFPSGRVGVIVPMDQQIPAARAKWAGPTSVDFAAASPYDGDRAALVAAADELVARGADAIVLDCMGYNESHRRLIRARYERLPVLVSGEVVAALVGAALG